MLRRNIAARIVEPPKPILRVGGIHSKNTSTPYFCKSQSVAPIASEGRGFRYSLSCTAPSNVQALASRIERSLLDRSLSARTGKLYDWNAAGNLEDFSISVSIGIAEWHEGDTLDEMLDGADRWMYEQKGNRL